MLQLEYICTEAEMREAQSLDLTKTSPAMRVRIYLFKVGVPVLLLVFVYFRLKDSVAPGRLPWCLAAALGLYFLFGWLPKWERKKPRPPVKVEISDLAITFIDGASRASFDWSRFSELVESPSLAVLREKIGRSCYIFPKRVFPDDITWNWFRATARQQAGRESSAGMAVAQIPQTAGGIVVEFRLGLADYVNRMFTTWLFKGILLLITGQCLFMSFARDDQAVNSPLKVYLIMLPVIILMFLLVSFFTWWMHSKYITFRRLSLETEGIRQNSSEVSGFMPWTTYKYWRENRWSFLVWNPRGQLWDMYPKRAFASAIDVERCRELLGRNLKKSRWYIF